jgi:carboxyl-terminal processing protease
VKTYSDYGRRASQQAISYPELMFRRLLVFFAALACAAQTLSPDQRRANLDSFEKVWTTVRDKHWDPKINGVDWKAVHDDLRPKIEAAKTNSEARAVLGEMLDRLHQTHFGIIPVDVYQDLESGGPETPGIDVRVLDGRAIVTQVDAGSSAEKKGVRPGWEIVKAGGQEIGPVLKKIRDQFAKSTLLDLRLSRAVLGRLMGASGTSAHVDFLDANDRAVALDLERAAPRGKVVSFGNLPAQHVWAEWRKPRPGVGYVAFNMFMDAELIAKTMQDAVEGCRDCKGFVIDLRGNPGGIGGLAMGVAGWFTDKTGQELGKMYLRTGTINFAVFPRPTPFLGPVAVLIDGSSASTAEILAGGMKDLHRARLFGTRTAGAALPSVIERLPNGDGFQYAIANYISSGGKPLAGIGAIPDEEVRLTRRGLLEGHDAPLDAAIDWIRKQK